MNQQRGKVRAAAGVLAETLESRLLLAAALSAGGAGILGDVNGDGKVDAADIDALAAQIQSPTPDMACDLNGDGKVDAQDFNHLVVDLLCTRPGDANLDGQVNGHDFLTWQVNYPMAGGATWSQGDFNGDGNVDGQDFLLWQQNYRFQRPPLQVVSATPSGSAGSQSIDVTFNQPVDPSTFTAGDVGLIPDEGMTVIQGKTVPDSVSGVGWPVLMGHYLLFSDPGGLEVMDYSNPAAPTPVSTFAPPAGMSVRDVQVSGSMACILVRGYSNGVPFGILEMVDLSSPQSPQLVGSLQLNDPQTGQALRPYDLAVEGQYAYFMTGLPTGGEGASDLTLQVVDISQPATPTQVGSVMVSPIGSYPGLRIAGTHAYITGLTYAETPTVQYCMSIVDISDPSAPSVVGSYITSSDTYDVAIAGSLAYVTEANSNWNWTLSILDVSDPSAPVHIGSLQLPLPQTSANVGCVAVAGSKLFLSDAYPGDLFIVDVSSPATPVLLTQAHLGLPVLAVLGSQLFAANGNQFVVMDITGPWPMNVGSVGSTSTTDVKTVGSTLYMAQSPGLVIANIADPSAPQVIGSFTAAQVPSRIEVQGHLAYLAEGNAGLEIVDVSDPSSPQLVGAIKTPGTAEDVIVAGGYAYVADGGAGLTIIDVSVPGSPEILSTNDIGAAATDLDVAGSRAYVIDTTAGLEIIDISNPASPQLLGACPGTAQARDVKVVGTTAYLANQGKLMVIDATQPQSPIVLANVACFAGTGGAALSVEVAGDIAYLTGVFRLSNTSNVLFTACAFDITDPSAPKVVMPMQLTGGRMLPVWNLAFSGDFVYAAVFNGLQAFQLNSYVQSITQLSPTTFRINLTSEIPAGQYFLQLGPDIAAVGGGLMDTNGNSTGGEGTQDVYSTELALT